MHVKGRYPDECATINFENFAAMSAEQAGLKPLSNLAEEKQLEITRDLKDRHVLVSRH